MSGGQKALKIDVVIMINKIYVWMNSLKFVEIDKPKTGSFYPFFPVFSFTTAYNLTVKK